jgi:hypothetical protein
VDVVLSGHEHNYERFAPQDPNGKADPQRGIWEFVVGTGARVTILSWLPSLTVKSTSDESYGVLKLILHPHSYEWQFVPVEGETFSESGSARCN